LKKILKEKSPNYSDKRVNEVVGNIWYNDLSDTKRKEIYDRDGKKKAQTGD